MTYKYYRFSKKRKKWFIIPPEKKRDTDIKIEEALIPVLQAAKKDCKNDLDFAMIIFGDVGTGKSTLGRLCCRFFSNEKFNPRSHMVRDVKDIKRVMKNTKKGDGIVFDEGSGIFAATDTMTKKTKYAQLVLDVCRQKNLLMIIIAPQFHRLTAPVAIDRTKVALRTYLHKKTKAKGYFAYYGTKKKNELYQLAKKKHGSISGVVPKWRGEFGKDEANDEEYRKVKDETLDIVLNSLEKPPTKTEKKFMLQRNQLLIFLKQKLECSNIELAKELRKFGIKGLSKNTIQEINQEYRKNR